jgi:hypothetical protein
MARPTHARPGLTRAVRLAVATAVVLLGGLIASGVASAAPGDVAWRDLSQRAPSSTDAYLALAAAPSGAVCAAGSTAATSAAPADALVCAYGSGGDVLWRRVWTWPGRSDDAAAALVRDRRGGYVVAGSSGPDWLLLKYSAGGYLQWVRRGNGPFARASFTSVAVDGSGNVYTAGTATPSGSDARVLICKYSEAGALRWQRSLASADGDAAATGLVLGAGDVYVTGRTAGGAAGSALTVKYSGAGVRRWLRPYTASADGSSRATGIAWAAGPVVCGWGGPAGGPQRGFLVQYDPAGHVQWTGEAGIPGATADRFAALAVDEAGGVCVAGTAVTSSGDSALTACFKAGIRLWALTQDGGQGSAVCRTPAGFAVASGPGSFRVTTVTPAGTAAWQRSITPAGYADFRPAVLRAAGSTYLYAAGSAAADAGGRAAVLVRYRP